MRYLGPLLVLALEFGLAPRLTRGDEGWVLGPFVKESAANPILGPSAEGVFDCPIRRGPVRFEELAIYNPAAVVRDGQVFLLYRAQDKDGTSRLGLALSRDGVRFVRQARPVLYPDEDARKADEWPGGCEDPRVVEDAHGYVLTYTAYDGTKARLAVATSSDLVHWTKHGLAFGRRIGTSGPSRARSCAAGGARAVWPSAWAAVTGCSGEIRASSPPPRRTFSPGGPSSARTASRRPSSPRGPAASTASWSSPARPLS